jgi:hypothetical protein
MKGYVSVGSEVSYELHSALLVYKRSARHGSDDAFITRHDVKKDEAGVPVLGPGETLTIEFVSDLMRAFQGKLDTQVLPENVLVHSFQRIVWWVHRRSGPCSMLPSGRRNSSGYQESDTRNRPCSLT